MSDSETQYLDMISPPLMSGRTQDDMTQGSIRLSAECSLGAEGLNDLRFGEWVEHHPSLFFTHLRALTPRSQEMLLSTFLLFKDQDSLTEILKIGNQSQASYTIRAAITHLAASLGHRPSGLRTIRKNVRVAKPRNFHVYKQDPNIFGQFRIDVSDPDFHCLFVPSTDKHGSFNPLPDHFKHQPEMEKEKAERKAQIKEEKARKIEEARALARQEKLKRKMEKLKHSKPPKITKKSLSTS